MKNKFKCWRKVEEKKDWKTFYNKEKSQNIFVFKEKKKWNVDLDTGEKFKKFDKELQALKFAKRYMKKHDVC